MFNFQGNRPYANGVSDLSSGLRQRYPGFGNAQEYITPQGLLIIDAAVAIPWYPDRVRPDQ